MKSICLIFCLAVFSLGSQAAEITLEGNDAMQYNIKEFKVKAGETVKLTLKHVGKLPKAAMGHNVVILKKGSEPVSWGMGVLGKGGNAANDYMPSDKSDIIAYTKMIGGGESTTIEFTAPSEKGAYPYVCTFLGHASLMNGKMIVE